MTEIKPDTSLYSDLPNKLRALATIHESSMEIEISTSQGWKLSTEGMCLKSRTAYMLNGGVDYRAKPKPRELWAVFSGKGKLLNHFSQVPLPGCEVICDRNHPDSAPHSVVRFVEQPADDA